MTGHVWITGAGSGIGEALALAMAEQGWRVMATGRRFEPLAALARRHDAISPWPLDVTDCDAVSSVVSRMPAPDMAILCAGTHAPTPAGSFDAADVRTLVETNLMGTVHCVAALLPGMLERGRGRLVLVASVAGYRGLPTAAGYCAGKAGVIALAESLRLDLAGSGIDIRLVNPGFVDTPLTRKNPFPMPDIISAETAAAAILDGLGHPGFEIAFPRRFAFAMRLLRLMPDRLYFPLIRRITG
ncbi:MAG: SDR family NAD(P)-dependent oxidoreductase [Telmatospirillum sp.]|nr:SDR family NAD(P)-dependent oxidoreductase [Telmatospirillum sp.]